MRLAWFSPWPPQPSGIAGRSADLVTRLAATGVAIDVFVDSRLVPTGRVRAPQAPSPGQIRVQSAHDFVWRHARGQFDLAVYQLGNSRLHEYIWPYLFRYPGLAVLHDARLHHARARALLSQDRAADYRTEFAFSHPAAAAAADMAVLGFDGPYHYLWPMTRAVVAASKLVAVHSRGSASGLAAAWPDAAIEYVALGEGGLPTLSDHNRQLARASLGLEDDQVAFGLFGGLTADKRVPEVVRAFAQVLDYAPRSRLVVAGAEDPAVNIARLAEELGITHAVIRCGVLDDDAFDRAIASVDVSINLRWPTALETSGPWLRALSVGLPTVVIALAHQTHVPALDPRDWTASIAGTDPVTIAVDILDEAHSLTRAMRRLVASPTLRVSLGQAARRYWEREHTVERMLADYERVIRRAVSLPDPIVSLPTHLRPDPAAHLRGVLAIVPEVSCELC